jgi:hypothetical protein
LGQLQQCQEKAKQMTSMKEEEKTLFEEEKKFKVDYVQSAFIIIHV